MAKPHIARPWAFRPNRGLDTMAVTDLGLLGAGLRLGLSADAPRARETLAAVEAAIKARGEDPAELTALTPAE